MPDCASDLPAALARIQALQQRATARAISLRRPPPQPTTCCGRGCNGCVWESYHDAVNFWLDDAEELLQP